MARLKQTARIVASSSGAQPSASAPAPPPPDATSFHDNARVYDWAPLALLAETSTLLPQGHLKSLLSNDPDEPSCAIDRENDFNIRIRIPPRGMPICADDRATNGVPFTFVYSAIFKRLKLRLPFTFFEKELMMELNVAPCQLHPNAWAFIRAFEILCNYFGHNASVDVFLYFFEAKNPGDRSWVSLNGVAGRVLLGLYQQSFKDWKGRFYMISATPQSSTLLEGFPLYWVPGVEFKKPRGLEVMAPYERELCGLFLGAKYSSALLIKHEFDVLALKKYIGSSSFTSWDTCTFPCILAYILTHLHNYAI